MVKDVSIVRLAVRKEVMIMDGGGVHLPTPKHTLRLRVKDKGATALLDAVYAPARVQADYVVNESSYLERSVVNGKLWLTIPGTSYGLPVEPLSRRVGDRHSWRVLWEELVVDIERYVGGEWVLLEDQKDWGVLKNVEEK